MERLGQPRPAVELTVGRFSGCKAWITGADTPVGRAVAEALAAEGCELLLSGTDTPPEGVSARCFKAEPATDAEAQSALEGFGPLDYFVHTAQHVKKISIEDCPVDTWEEEMDANLMTLWCGARAAVRAIGKDRGGAMVFVSSIHDDKPTGSAFTFSCAQGAISMIMKEASLDYGRLGIRVNLLEAGPLPGDDDRFRGENSDFYVTMTEKIPLHRAADAKELAKPVLFLLSDEASYINGAALRADGGYIGYYGDGDSERRWDHGNA